MKNSWMVLVMVLVSSISLEAASWCRNTSALNRTERAICSSSTLRNLDDEMARAYGAAKARRGDVSQRRWLRNVRNSCGSDRSCLRRVYRSRIDELRRMSQGGHRARGSQVASSDIELRSEGYTTFGNTRAKIVKFGGYSTPECRLAISTSGRYFYMRKMHSTCWKGTNRKGIEIICNRNKSVCKTRSELIAYAHGGVDNSGSKYKHSDTELRSEGYTTFGNTRAKIVKFGGYSTPECRLAISTNGRSFYLTKMHSTCWKGTNRKGVEIICNRNKSVCKTRSELRRFVRYGDDGSSEKYARKNSSAQRESTADEDAIELIGMFGGWLKSAMQSGSSSSSSNTPSYQPCYSNDTCFDITKIDGRETHIKCTKGSHTGDTGCLHYNGEKYAAGCGVSDAFAHHFRTLKEAGNYKCSW